MKFRMQAVYANRRRSDWIRYDHGNTENGMPNETDDPVVKWDDIGNFLAGLPGRKGKVVPCTSIVLREAKRRHRWSRLKKFHIATIPVQSLSEFVIQQGKQVEVEIGIATMLDNSIMAMRY